MVKLNKETICYYCGACELAYQDKKKACECEEWCKKHKNCNVEIIKHSLKMKGEILK
jgi:hypothetical protein